MRVVVSWLVVLFIVVGLADPLRAEEGNPSAPRTDGTQPDSSWFTRLGRLDPAQLNTAGQSSIALIAAVTALWNFPSHVSNIRQGIHDWTYLRTNRRNYLTERQAFADFVSAVTRATSSQPDNVFFEPPSLVQQFDGHLDEWVRAVNAVDEHVRGLLREGDTVVTFERARRDLATHLRFNITNHVAGMMYDEDLPSFREAAHRWEVTGHAGELDRWIDRQLASPVSRFNREESGRRWLLRYVALQQRLAATQWLEPNVRSMLRLEEWLRVNDPRRWGLYAPEAGTGILTEEQVGWYLGLQETIAAEKRALQIFSREFNGLIDQLNGQTARYGDLGFSISFVYPETRAPGQLHVDARNGAQALLVSKMTGHFGQLCGIGLAAAQKAKDDAAAIGTAKGMALRTCTKILMPAALIATGITGLILASKGLHGVLQQLFFVP